MAAQKIADVPESLIDIRLREYEMAHPGRHEYPKVGSGRSEQDGLSHSGSSPDPLNSVKRYNFPGRFSSNHTQQPKHLEGLIIVWLRRRGYGIAAFIVSRSADFS